MPEIKVHIADDHAIMVDGLEMLINAMENFTVLHTSNSGKEALLKIQKEPVDLLIADLDMPGMGGLELIRTIRSFNKEMKAICLTAFNDTEVVAKAFAAGANGFICKQSLKEDLEASMNAVLQGGSVLKTQACSAPLDDHAFLHKNFAREHGLSEREVEIIIEIAKTGNKVQTAKNLFLSPYTVQTHLKRINKKIHTSSLSELIAFAYQKKLI